MIIELTNRSILLVDGIDAGSFLLRVTTNSIKQNGLTYSAILTPKGIVVNDFFIFAQEEWFAIDCNTACLEELVSLLTMYKLSSKVAVRCADEFVVFSSENMVDGALCCYADPRSSAMGYRLLVNRGSAASFLVDASIDDYDCKRIEHFIPEVCKDILPNTHYPFDYGLDFINCIDFNKGCYIGQEVTCMMKYRKKRCKRLCIVKGVGFPKAGEILLLNGSKVGIMGSNVGGVGLALIEIALINGRP
ncbi:putative tRNA-modifying protein YgfZ [Candidatus Xenohaliotis californiensis]|uniref:tRNA-modifying protein YgfZ n=2 Tax=Candidatus Xenohaliotis californiensis TaxID=84677 RepID=A0ABP0ETV8_9RICK|nr:putative tRNA-modifying protein YgfZ [Candidatus Xenohaliotis californiensis]